MVPGEGFVRAFVAVSTGMLFLLDFAGLLLAGMLSAWLTILSSALSEPFGGYPGVRYLLVVTSLLAAVVLHDPRFCERARRCHWSALTGCYLTRFLLVVGGVFVIGVASSILGTIPTRTVIVWLTLSFMLASLTRAGMVGCIRGFTRSGALVETVAIVGSGSLTDWLKQDPVSADRQSLRVIGVFEDSRDSVKGENNTLAGTIDDLIELGKTCHLDWIFIDIPSANTQQLALIVRRLKSLAVPIALCPWNFSLQRPCQDINYVGNTLPVSVLVDRRAQRVNTFVQTVCQFMPRWITTLLLLPMSLVAFRRSSRTVAPIQRSAARTASGSVFQLLREPLQGHDAIKSEEHSSAGKALDKVV